MSDVENQSKFTVCNLIYVRQEPTLAIGDSKELSEEKEASFADGKLKLDTENEDEIIQTSCFCNETTIAPYYSTVCKQGAKEDEDLEKQHFFIRRLFEATADSYPKTVKYFINSILLDNSQLVQLILNGNELGTGGLLDILKLLESSSCYTLQELNLNNNGLGISGAKMLAESLCKSVENSQRDGNPLSLKIFVCGRNHLENEGAIAVSKFFKMLGTLQSVKMPQNGIYGPGIENLAEAFKSNPNLQVINLEGNILSEGGAQFMANCLPYLNNISVLNFQNCLIETEGAILLTETLGVSCPKLSEVVLGFDEINLEVCTAIVKAMEKKDMLKMFGIDGNFSAEEVHWMFQQMEEGDDNNDVEGDAYENWEHEGIVPGG